MTTLVLVEVILVLDVKLLLRIWHLIKVVLASFPSCYTVQSVHT